MNWWSVIGLFLDGVGVLVLFFYPPPAEPMYQDGGEPTTYTTELDRSQNLMDWRWQSGKARAGLLIVFIGFILQFVGQLVGRPLPMCK